MTVISRNEPCPCNSGLKYKKCCLVHEGQFTVFVDEAGNSGANYLDLDQPFYIVGGWIIPNSKIADSSLVREVATDLRVDGELKGTNLTGNRRNQTKFNEMFDTMVTMGCKPTMVLAEKKYCIAAKVIETFLDPAYNNKVTNRYTYDNIMKKELAEKVYKLSFDTLKQFAHAYRLLEVELLEQSLFGLCEELKANHEHDLANKLLGATNAIEEICSLERGTRVDFLPNQAAASLNVPAFIAFVNHLEGYARLNKYRLTIVHDKTRAYEEGYKEVYRLYSEATDFQYRLTDGTNILMGFSHLKQIQFHNSQDSPWIQSADVLISALNRFLKLLYNNQEVNDELLALGRFISPAVIDDGIKFGDSICSKETRSKIINAISSR